MSINPITRKEMFMAKAAGMSAPELTPVTREEMFLEEIPPGGGGGSDVLGEDGIIKQEHLPEGYPYKTVEEGYILEDVQPAYEADSGAFIWLDKIEGIEADNEYTVNWNGTEYKTKAVSVEQEGASAICLGNIGALTGDESQMTDDLYAILITPPDMVASGGFGALMLDLSGATSLTVSIKGEVARYIKLDNNYLGMDWIPENVVNQGDSYSVRMNSNVMLEALDYHGSEFYLSVYVHVYDNTNEVEYKLNRREDNGVVVFGNLSLINDALPDTGELYALTTYLSNGIFVNWLYRKNGDVGITYTVYPFLQANNLPPYMLPINRGIPINTDSGNLWLTKVGDAALSVADESNVVVKDLFANKDRYLTLGDRLSYIRWVFNFNDSGELLVTRHEDQLGGTVKHYKIQMTEVTE